MQLAANWHELLSRLLFPIIHSALDFRRQRINFQREAFKEYCPFFIHSCYAADTPAFRHGEEAACPPFQLGWQFSRTRG
jgi:hypothetical protein